MADEPWWMRLDLNIPEALETPAACLRYVRRVLRELAALEREHEAWKLLPEVVGNQVALDQAEGALNSIHDNTAKAIYEVMRRMAGMEATRVD